MKIHQGSTWIILFVAKIAIEKIKLIFQLILIFFGLDRSYKEYQLEDTYILIKHLGFTYRDACSIAVPYRKWFIDRYVKELEQINKKDTDDHGANRENSANLKSYEEMINKKFAKDI